MFGRKKEPERVEAPVMEANQPRPPMPPQFAAPQPTAAQMFQPPIDENRQHIDYFSQNYAIFNQQDVESSVQNEILKCNLMFGIYMELRKINARLK